MTDNSDTNINDDNDTTNNKSNNNEKTRKGSIYREMSYSRSDSDDGDDETKKGTAAGIQASAVEDGNKKIVPKKTNWQKIKAYGAWGVGIWGTQYLGGWIGIWAALHYDYIDVNSIIDGMRAIHADRFLSPERVHKAMTGKWGEFGASFVVNEALDWIKLPFVLALVPPIKRSCEFVSLKIRGNKQIDQENQAGAGTGRKSRRSFNK